MTDSTTGWADKPALSAPAPFPTTPLGNCDDCGGATIRSQTLGIPVHDDPRNWAHDGHRVRLNGMCSNCTRDDHSKHHPEHAGICYGCSCIVGVTGG